MWESLKDFLPGWLAFICTMLVFIVPYAVYTINKMLHDYGDPPWKKDEKKEK